MQQKSGKRKRKENAAGSEKKEKKMRQDDNADDAETKKLMVDNRVTIVDRLNAKDPRPALIEFTEKEEKEEMNGLDIVEEFFSCGGQVNTLFKVLEMRDHKVKANDVALVFTACHKILMQVVRSEDTSLAFGGRGYSFCQEMTKRILEDYDKELTLLFSGQNTSEQAKSVLKLLTGMVTLGISTTKMVLVKLDWDSSNWETLPKRISKKESPDVRTCYIHFLLSFLMEPNQVTLKEYFERRTRLSSIFPGLLQDPPETVHLVLQTFRSKILENPAVSKTHKMKLFGSHNLKPILGLFNWTGPKKSKQNKEEEDDEDNEEHLEELEEIKSSLMDFLNVLLTSHKFGVVFQDAEYGCEKRANNLISEVLGQLNKPWESEDLASLTSVILAHSPAEINHFLDALRSEWKPRASRLWLKLVHMLFAVFSNLNVKHIVDSYKKTNKVGLHVLKTIMMPPALLEEVLVPGLSMQSEDPGLAKEDETVSRNSLELLSVLVRNTEEFIKGTNKPVLEKELRFLLKDRFPTAQTLMSIWKQELSSHTRIYIPHILSVITFYTRYIDRAAVDIVQVLRDLESLQFTAASGQSLEHESTNQQSQEKRLDPRIQTLQIITNILGAESQHGNFLKRFLTEETICLLLNCLRSETREEQEEAKTILDTIGAQTKICLSDATDLNMLLALKPKKEIVPELGRVLMRSVNNLEELEEEILGFDSCNISQEETEEILDALMDNQLDKKTKWPTKTDEVALSPLMMSLLEADLDTDFTDFLHTYLECLVLVLPDPTALLAAVNNKCHIFSPTFIRQLEALANPPTASQKSAKIQLLDDAEAAAAAAPVLRAVHCAQLVRQCCTDSAAAMIATLKNFLEMLPDDQCADLVRQMRLEELFKKFDPYQVDDDSEQLHILILSYTKKFDINVDFVGDRIVELTRQCLKRDKEEKCDKSKIRETFRNLQMPASKLLQLLDSCLELGVTRFVESGKLTRSGHILTAILNSLGADSAVIQDLSSCLLQRLSCHVEYILQHSVEEDDLGQAFAAFLSCHPSTVVDQLATNLFYVCVARLEQEVNRSIASQMVLQSAKMFHAFGEWMVKSKSKLEAKAVLCLVQTLIEKGSAKSISGDKKLLKVIVKQVLASASECLQNLHDADVVGNAFRTAVFIIDTLKADITSSKTLTLVDTFYSENKSALKNLRSDAGLSCLAKKLLVQFNYALHTILQSSGSFSKKELLNHVLVPTIELIVEVLKPGGSLEYGLIKELCDVGHKTLELQTSSAVKNYLKKNKREWSAFIKGVLKHGLRGEDVGEPALLFLSSLCSSRYSGTGEEEENQDFEDEEEMKLVVEMITSHSSYLPLVMGGHSVLKTRVLDLLSTLAPASCRQEQIKPLLSGYGATLLSSDRATLRLLSVMERHGVNIAMQRPMVFGKLAVKQFANQAAKANKVSDCLASLNPDLVQRTINNFPVSLNLDPVEEVNILAEEEESVYDPRFLLPYLSTLTSGEIYIDRHMKLVECGAISFALVSLSSQDSEIRGMGYHILHRFYLRMSEAKMLSEKQIWIHIISLVKHGLAAATESKTCVKLPSVTTLFLARSLFILCNPSHLMYNSISTFLLAKPTMNLFTVPEFLRLFHSKDVNAATQRSWILSVLRDGLRDRLDHQMFVQQYVYKLIFSNFSSCLADRNSQLIILEILERSSRISAAAFDLVANQGVAQWLALISSTLTDKKLAVLVVSAFSNMFAAIRSADNSAAKKIAEEQELQDRPKKTTLRDILRANFDIVSRHFAKFPDTDLQDMLQQTQTAVIVD